MGASDVQSKVQVARARRAITLAVHSRPAVSPGQQGWVRRAQQRSAGCVYLYLAELSSARRDVSISISHMPRAAVQCGRPRCIPCLQLNLLRPCNTCHEGVARPHARATLCSARASAMRSPSTDLERIA